MDLRQRLKERTFRSGFAGGPVEVPDGDTKSNLHRAGMVQKRLRKMMLDFYDEVDQVNDNEDLTDSGKSKQLRDLGKKYLGQIDGLRESDAHLKPIDSQLAELQAKINPQSDGEEPSLIDALRQIEVTRFIGSQDEAERIKLFFHAIESGDSVTYNAVAQAPKIFGLVPDEILTKGRERWGQQQSPAVFAQYSELKQARDRVQTNITEATANIRNEAGLPKDDFGGREVVDIDVDGLIHPDS
jgi:hypothetical protein